MNSLKDRLRSRGFEEDVKVWTGTEIVKMFAEEEKLRLTPAALKIYSVKFT